MVSVEGAVRPLIWISWVNHVISLAPLMVVSALISLYIGVADSEVTIIFALFLLLPSIIVWRNANVISCIRNKYIIISYILILIFCCLIILAMALTGSWPKEKDDWFGLVIIIYVIPFIFLAIAAVIWLRHKKINGIGILIIDIVKQLEYFECKTGLNIFKPQRLWLGVILFLFGLIIYVIPDFLNLDYSNQNSYRLSQGAAQISIAFILYARSCFQPVARTVLQHDKRPPILLLRSFADDREVAAVGMQSNLIDVSLETRLSTHFSKYGPFIAVGSPSDKLPFIGAARARLSDDEWQAQVQEWIDQASVILMMSGTTKWVDWELRQVLERKAIDRLIIGFPPYTPKWSWKGKANKRFQSNMGGRLRQVRISMADSPWSAALEAVDAPESLRAMIFNADGSVTPIRARSRNRNAYHLAILVAHWLLLRNAGRLKALPERVPGSEQKYGNWGAAAIAGLVTFVAGAAALGDGGIGLVWGMLALSGLAFALLWSPPVARRLNWRRWRRAGRVMALLAASLPGLHGCAVYLSETLAEERFEGGRMTADAVSAIQYAAWSGLPVARFNLGVAYLNGLAGLTADPQRGCGMIRDAWDGGFGRAGVRLGLCLLNGYLPPRPGETLPSLLEQPAQEGNALAMLILADHYVQDGPGRDPARAAQYYQRALDQGEGEAAYMLSLMYRRGDGVDEDMQKSMDYLHQGAALRSPRAMAEAGAWALDGNPRGLSIQQAVDYNRQAAEAGIPLALVNYGIMLLDGIGVERDLPYARTLFQQALLSDDLDIQKAAREQIRRVDDLIPGK